MMLQGKLGDEHKTHKQQGERGDLARKTLHDRQAELDLTYQRIIAAEAASHDGKNKAQVLLQPCLKVGIFHSICLSCNSFLPHVP